MKTPLLLILAAAALAAPTYKVVGKIKKELRRVPVGADVQQRQHTLGDHPRILVHQEDRAQANQQNKDAFGEFEESNQPQQTPLRWTETDFRCRRGHAAALVILRVPRPPTQQPRSYLAFPRGLFLASCQLLPVRTAARNSFTISRDARIAAAC